MPEDIPGIERTMLPHGVRSLMDCVNADPRLDFEEQARIFERIKAAPFVKAYVDTEHAEGTPLPEAITASQDQDTGLNKEAWLAQTEADRHRLAWSFMPLVIGMARKRMYARRNFEDYIQNGFISLYTAIELYAHLDEQRSFARYAAPFVRSAMFSHDLNDLFNTNLGKALQNALSALLAAEQQAREQNTPLDVDKVQKTLEASPGTMRAALFILRIYRQGGNLPLPDDYEFRAPDQLGLIREGLDPPALSPKLDMALLLLTPGYRHVIELYFGLAPSGLTLSREEIAANRGTAVESVRGTMDKALAELRLILKNLDTYGTAFNEWEDQKYFKKRLNVLTYCQRAGLPIPRNISMDKLRVRALEDLSRSSATEEEKQMVADMFGLHPKERLTIGKLMEKYGYSTGWFSQVAKKVISDLESKREPEEPSPLEKIAYILEENHEAAIRFHVDDLRGLWAHDTHKIAPAADPLARYITEAEFYVDLLPGQLRAAGMAVQRGYRHVLYLSRTQNLGIEDAIRQLEQRPDARKALIDSAVAYATIMRAKRRLVVEALGTLSFDVAKKARYAAEEALGATVREFNYAAPANFNAQALSSIGKAIRQASQPQSA